MRRHAAILLMLSATAFAPPASSQEPAVDWPGWLGPNHNGSVRSIALGGEAPRLRKAWSFKVAGGSSGIAVVGNRAYTLATDGENEEALALSAKDGAVVWRAALGPHVDDGFAPGSTPVVSDGRVFAVGNDCKLTALDAATGRVLWTVNFKEKFGATLRRGCVSSPLVEEGRLIAFPGGQTDHRIVSLDPATGNVVWSTKGVERVPYASPVIANLGGEKQVLAHHISAGPPQASGLGGFRLSDGSLLWSQTFENVSTETPLVVPEGVLLLSWRDARLVRPGSGGAGSKLEVAWAKAEFKSRVAPPVYRDGYFYGFNEDNLQCVKADTGTVAWRERTYPGSLILVGDRLVVLSANAGLLRIVDASPVGYKERTRLEVLTRGAAAEAPPSFGAGTIFVRSEDEIVAVAVDRR